jgi:hypothetical protein
LGDFNAKVGREDIFKPSIENEGPQEIIENGVRVNFATSKNLVVKSTTLPHRDIRKYSWISSEERPKIRLMTFLVDRRRHWCI